MLKIAISPCKNTQPYRDRVHFIVLCDGDPLINAHE